jgi:hypothetical protein
LDYLEVVDSYPASCEDCEESSSSESINNSSSSSDGEITYTLWEADMFECNPKPYEGDWPYCAVTCPANAKVGDVWAGLSVGSTIGGDVPVNEWFIQNHPTHQVLLIFVPFGDVPEITLEEARSYFPDECVSDSSSEGFSESSSSESGGGDPAPKACGTTNCAKDGAATTCPDMIIRVSGSTGANVTWCGETWTPAQVSAMEERRVCPGNYNLYRSITVTHEWNLAPGGGDYGLQMKRYAGFANARLQVLGSLLYDSRSSGGGFFYNGLGVLTAGTPAADATNYLLSQTNNNFFGPTGVQSFTQGSLTYTWRQGDNWDVSLRLK